MNDLVVNNQLSPTVIDDQRPHTAPSIGECCRDLSEQVALVNDRQALLNIARLSHAHHSSSLGDVQDAILLEDGSKHALNIDTWLWVAHEATLFLELAGEEVDAEVAVLAGLRRHGDADDLAGTALEDDQVADADEVAWDCDGVAGDAAARLDEPDALDDASTLTRRAATFVFNDHLLALTVMEGMQDAVGGPFNTATERVVFALVVVVTHVSSWLVVDDFFFLDFYFCGWSTSFVFDVVVWLRAAAVVAFGDVDLTLDDLVSSLASAVLNVDGVSGLATVGGDVEDLVSSLASVVLDVDGISGSAT